MERLLRCALGRMSCFGPRQLSQLIWAVARLGFLPGRAWMDRFADKARCQFRSFDARGLANTAWAFATMGHYRPNDAWTRELCAHFARDLRHASPQAVANTLWALGRLRVRPEDAWIQGVLAHMAPGLLAAAAGGSGRGSGSSGAAVQLYRLQDVAYTCYGLTRLQCAPPPPWLDAAAAAAARAVLASASERPGGRVLAAALAADSQHLALLLHSLARLRHVPPLHVRVPLFEALVQLLPHAGPQDLPMAVSAIAALQRLRALPVTAPAGSAPASSAAASAPAGASASAAAPAAPASSASAAAVGNPRAPAPALLSPEAAGALLLACHRQLPRFTAQGHAMVLAGFVSLGVDPGRRWLLTQEAALQQLVAEADAARQHQQQQQQQDEDMQQPAQQQDEAGGSNTRSRCEDSLDATANAAAAAAEWALPARARCQMLYAIAKVLSRRPLQVAPPAAAARPAAAPALAQPGMPGPSRLPVRPPLAPAAPAPVAAAKGSGAAARNGRRAWAEHGGLLRLLLPEQPQLSRCNAQDLAQLAWALGRLRLTPPRRYSAALLAAAAARLQATAQPPADPAVDATPAHATVPTGTPSAEDGVDEARGGRGNTGDGCTVAGLAMTAWGLSSCGVWPPQSFQAAVAAALLRLQKQQQQGPAGGPGSGSAGASRLSPQAVVMVLGALARWHRLPKASLRLPGPAATAASGSLRRARGRAVAGVPSSRARSDAHVRAVAQLALFDSCQRPAAYGPRALCWMLWSLAALGVRQLPAAWVAQFGPRPLLRLLPKLPSSYRVLLLDSLGRLGLRPGPDWLGSAEQLAEGGAEPLPPSAQRGLRLALARLRGQGQGGLFAAAAAKPRVTLRRPPRGRAPGAAGPAA